MALEKVTLKNVRVTVNFDIDLDTLKHYLDRLNEQGEPENIRAFFDIDPETLNLLEDEVKRSIKFKTSFHPHLKRIK